jgi:hypothetical protein
MAGQSTSGQDAGEVPVRDESLVIGGLRLHHRDWGIPPPRRCSCSTVAISMPIPGTLSRGGWQTGIAWEALAGRQFDRQPPGLLYAARHPDRVERLVILEGFVAGFSTPGGRAFFELLDNLPDRFADLDAAVSAFRAIAPRSPEGVLRHFVSHSLKRAPGGDWVWRLDPALRAPGSFPIAPDPAFVRGLLPQVACPALLACGEHSFNAEAMLVTAAAIPRAQVAYIPDAGHMVLQDNPAGCLDVVRPFLLGD